MLHSQNGVGFQPPQGSFQYNNPLQRQGTGGGGGGNGLDFDILSQLLPGGIGIGMGFLGNVLGGDGGQGKRIKEAQGVGRELFGAKFNQANIDQQRGAFQKGLTPYLNELYQKAAGRVGLDSGIGHGAVLGKIGEYSSSFETQAIMGELQRVLQQRLGGANILQGLAR